MTMLHAEIRDARAKIDREGLDFSIGEIASLYEQGELIISPPYQRLFRWEDAQKTRLVESIFLNVPIPAIFVYTKPDGKWELVDGLQRVSTCLQFMGRLRDHERFICGGTNFLPSLGDVYWPSETEGNEPGALPIDLQLNFKRARLRIEVLKQDTDPQVRFELFQRLNTGGSNLSEQEVRSCIIYSINPDAFDALLEMATDTDLLAAYDPTDRMLEEQHVTELVVRAVCLRHVDYDGRKDIHEYLNSAIIQIVGNRNFNWKHESDILHATFAFVHKNLGARAFFRGNSRSLGLAEFVTLGISRLIENNSGGRIDVPGAKGKYREILGDADLVKFTKGGVRGTDRWRNFLTKRAYDYFTQ